MFEIEEPIVLIIEDRPSALTARKIVLQQMGYKALTASSLYEALTVLSDVDSINLDLVVTDMNLDPSNPHDLSGASIAKLVRRVRPGTPVIGYSSFFLQEEVEHGDEIFDVFLSKMSDSHENIEEIFQEIDRVIQSRREAIRSDQKERTDQRVFLCHNTSDKPIVRRLAKKLKKLEVEVWFDEWDLKPGRPWQEELESAIEAISTALVLVGQDGIGPWADREMRAVLEEFVRRNISVIPVLLPGAGQQPDLPLFLRQFTWVDLREGLRKDGLARIMWGISGDRTYI
ncbi:MAG: TIR domain-containing protein [Roseovarius confluentis]